MTAASDALKHLTTPRVDASAAPRRSVVVGSWDDLSCEVERVERASRPDGEGLRVTGNWSAGQILEHLARTIERSIDGFGAAPPTPPTPPTVRGARLFGRRGAPEDVYRKSRALTLPMSPGSESAAAPGEIDPAAQVWTRDGAARLGAAIRRAREGHAMDKPSPTLGRMTRADWETFHFRHAALHLSFVAFGEWR
jgi:hypothetical protein